MLKPKQRAYLKGLANTLNPIVFVGKDGADADVASALAEALLTHELVKVRFNAHKDEVAESAQNLADSAACDLVSVIGFVATYYRRAAEPEKRFIQLPK